MLPLELPPGVVQGPTKASTRSKVQSNYSEANLVRWDGGSLKPVGGWSNLYMNEAESIIRRVHEWIDNDGVKWRAFLCEEHLYVDSGDGLIDITPTGGITAPPVLAGGYGDSLYGAGSYGTPRPPSFTKKPIGPAYTLGNWGEWLLAMSSNDGRLLFWDPNSAPGTLAAAVTNAPTGNRTFLVTPDRHVVLFGMGGNPRSFGWCDQEDIEDWNFASTLSKAGFFDVEPAAPILTASLTKNGFIFFTTKMAYVSEYVGLPYVYSYDKIGRGNNPISSQSIVDTDVGTMWFTTSGFRMYDGVSVIPVDCPVWNWIKDSFNERYSRYYAHAFLHTAQSEYWWFFVSDDATECDRYVMYNFAEGWWSMGKLSRTAAVASDFDSYPVMCSGNDVYLHETSTQYGGAAELPWAETFVLNVDNGSMMMTIDQMIVDVEGDIDSVGFSFYYKDDRRSDVAEKVSPLKTARSNGWMEVRRTGRDFRMRIQALTGENWTTGQHLLEIKTRGIR